MTLLLASLVKASLILALGLVATLALRRRSASVRHAILASAITCAALMPALELLLPQVTVMSWPTPAVMSSGLTLTSDDTRVALASSGTTSTGTAIPWTQVVVGVWLAASLVTLGGLVTGLVRLRRLRRRCAPVSGRWRALTDELSRACGVTRSVALLESDDASLLVTYGVLRPGIILPAGAAHWTDDRMRVVLRHELAHIARRDAGVQLIGEALRIMQPLNPFVWIACHRLRQESEYACDDAVLRGGVNATDYATHLFDVAKHLSGRHIAWASAPAIAHPSTLERRIVAMLHTHNTRSPLTRRGWSIAALVALGVSLPLAAASVAPPAPSVISSTESEISAEFVATITPPAEAPASTPVSAVIPAVVPTVVPAPVATAQTGAISGTVTDQTAGVIPGATVTLTGPNGATATAVSNVRGQFVFRDLPTAAHELSVSLSGFGTVRATVTPAAGATTDHAVTLPIGSLTETMSMNCAPTSAMRQLGQAIFPVLAAQQPPATPIRVGGNIRAPQKVRNVRPVCPAGLPLGDTMVQLSGVVGIDGLIHDMEAVPDDAGTQPHAAAAAAALDAVRQWTFTPTQLNGQPVDVNITVTVTFSK